MPDTDKSSADRAASYINNALDGKSGPYDRNTSSVYSSVAGSAASAAGTNRSSGPPTEADRQTAHAAALAALEGRGTQTSDRPSTPAQSQSRWSSTTAESPASRASAVSGVSSRSGNVTIGMSPQTAAQIRELQNQQGGRK